MRYSKQNYCNCQIRQINERELWELKEVGGFGLSLDARAEKLSE